MSALKRKLEGIEDAAPLKVAKVDNDEEEKVSLLVKEKVSDEEDNDEGEDDVELENEVEDGDDDEEEDVDEDVYEEDGFIVKEGEDEELDDQSMSDEDPFEKSKRKANLKKLRKNTGTLVLDEDDQLLIQESSRPKENEIQHPEPNEGDEIIPDDFEEESDVDDFIEDDFKGPSTDKSAIKRRARRQAFSRRGGPTYDQIQEAREIFGDGYDELGADNFDEEEQLVNEEQLVSRERTGVNFEYIQLVQNFCLDEDEAVRGKDEPERFQLSAHTSRQVANLEELSEEAFWISTQLDLRADLTGLVRSVEAVLRFILVDKLEIPFIWLYRRDYLIPSLRRDDLWKIFWLDSRWYEMSLKQRKLLHRCSSLENAAKGLHPVAEDILKQFPIRQYSDFIQSHFSEVVLQDTVSYFTLLCEGYGFSHNQKNTQSDEMMEMPATKRENYKASKYRKYKSLRPVQEIASLICNRAHEIGFALLHSTFPMIPQVSRPWEEEASDLIAATDLTSVPQLLSAATIVIATEICHEPVVRHYARAAFRNRASISTKPTVRGKAIITPFSQYFGIHCLENKPIEEFFRKEGLKMFMSMIEAENSGLIEIVINPPQKREGDQLVPDLEPFFADKLKLFQFFMPPIPADLDQNPSLRFSWDIVRLSVLQATVDKYLIPFLKADIRSELLRQAKDYVLEETCREFEKKLTVGPCGPAFDDDREFVANALLSCPDRQQYNKVVSIFVTQDQPPGVHMAAVDVNGVLTGQFIIAPQVMGQRKEKIKAFLYEHRPELIVINSGGLSTSRDIFHIIQKSVISEITETIELDRNYKRQQALAGDSDDEGEGADEEVKYSPKVFLISDVVANIAKNSTRKDASLSDLPSDTVASVCLARFAQEPLSEYCNLWRTVDSSYLFGFESLFLNLHPFQKFLLREKVVERLQACLLNAVADFGVDLNKAIKFDHHANLLAFIPGLGLRKADSLRQQILRSTGYVESREVLLTNKFLGKVVWNNCCAFLKIKSRNAIENPLEMTRIHPECYLMYDFAPKICADALAVDCNPSRYSDIVVKLMKSVRHDLEKRIHKFPEWLDRWQRGKPEYYIEGEESSMTVSNGHSISIELQDCLSTLLLEEFVQELENRGKGKRRIQFEHIKEELRYPWLDLRKPMQSVSTSELFDLLYGESQYSLYVGLKTGFTVQEIQDQTFYESENNNIRRRQRAIVKTDSGIKGFIHANEVFDDDRYDYSKLSDVLKVGDHMVGTIVSISKDKFSVDISLIPSILERSETWWMRNRFTDMRAKRYWEQMGKNPSFLFDRYFNEKEALQLSAANDELPLPNGETVSNMWKNKGGIGKAATEAGITSRVVYHPLFVNTDFRGAEEKLRNERKGAGAVLVRPSSRGNNFLALTWAFQENWFKHINIEEQGKRPNELGLGSKLIIRDENFTYEFADLDELYVTFIEPMNDLVSTMTKHRSFRYGTPDEVEQAMRDELKQQPGRIPYYVRFDPQKPGVFVLTWLSLSANSTSQIKTLKIDVQPKGYRVGKEMFSRPSELIMWFKKMNERNR